MAGQLVRGGWKTKNEEDGLKGEYKNTTEGRNGGGTEMFC